MAIITDTFRSSDWLIDLISLATKTILEIRTSCFIGLKVKHIGV